MSYPFPKLTNGIVPRWQQNYFLLDEKKSAVLDYLYDDANLGWSDGLTQFHEENAGDNHFIDKASRQNTLYELKKHVINPNAVILEVGCSSGYMLAEIQKNFPHAFVMGADIVHEPLIHLAKQMPSTPLMRFDLTKCPLPDNSIDAIVILNVLEHIKDDDQALKQIFRILKPNGILIIEVPAGPKLYDIYDKLLMHFRRYQAKDLRKLVLRNRLKILRLSHLGFFMYPAFWLVKKRNRLTLNHVTTQEMQQKISQDIHNTRQHILLKKLMAFELTLGKILNYPCGIRCLMTCQK